MDRFIADLRRQLRDLMRREGNLPVYGYLPDDVAHLPCTVIGRPSIGESGTPAVMTMSVDVYVLGRRLSDEDAQAELDAYADEAFDVLGATRGVKINDQPQLARCVDVSPGTVNVAGLEMPVYSFSVAYDVMTC